MAADAVARRAELRAAVVELRDRGLHEARPARPLARPAPIARSAAKPPRPNPGPAFLRPPRLTLRRPRHAQSSKWCAEMLAGLPPPGPAETPPPSPPPPAANDADDVYLLARAFFDAKEYRRAEHALEAAASESSPRARPPHAHALPPGRSFFLRCYSRYLAGERRKRERSVEVAGPLGKSDVANAELHGLESLLRAAAGIAPPPFPPPPADGPPPPDDPRATAASLPSVVAAAAFFPAMAAGRPVASMVGGSGLDPYCWFLLGQVMLDRGDKDSARHALSAAVRGAPCHWGAWLALQAACGHESQTESLALPCHWAADFFRAGLALRRGACTVATAGFAALTPFFPTAAPLAAAAATSHYASRDLEEAQAGFERLLRADPYRLEHQDAFSNILYVREAAAPLSFLAHRAMLVDKARRYRPETCCIVGNYYSLRGQHEKAVVYFQRALKVAPTYLAAWTLLGHEFIELKNTAAAVAAYRRAVDLDGRDYRPWYGLGQTYELMGMPAHALHYFKTAASLHPEDARMWCALGACYEAEPLGAASAAARCYCRALARDEREGIALHKLAALHARLGQPDLAAGYYARNLARIDAESAAGADAAEALQYLAGHARAAGRWADAEAHCLRLLDFGGHAREGAKALMRELRAESAAGGPGMARSTEGVWAGGEAPPLATLVAASLAAAAATPGRGGAGMPMPHHATLPSPSPRLASARPAAAAPRGTPPPRGWGGIDPVRLGGGGAGGGAGASPGDGEADMDEDDDA